MKRAETAGTAADRARGKVGGLIVFVLDVLALVTLALLAVWSESS